MDTVTFAQWTMGREIDLLSTNAGSETLAFQSWRNFKEAFAPELVAHAITDSENALGRKIKTCIDPFGGSGTTAISCQFLGIEPYTIEVNPYLCDLIKAKIGKYNIDTLIRDFEKVSKKGGRLMKSPFDYAPPTFVEPGVKGNFLFYLPVAQRLQSIMRRIEGLSNPSNRRLLRILLGAISVECSNAIISGKGRRYRKRWKTREIEPGKVDELFSSVFLKAIYDLQRYKSRQVTTGSVVLGDSRKKIPADRIFDIAIFSPPYPNSLDYTDVYNIELWICGYLQTPAQNTKLRSSTLRSHVQIKRSLVLNPTISTTLTEVYAELVYARARLWDKHIPEMIIAYFDDMMQIFSGLKRSLREDSRCLVVVGDSKYASINVPVSKILVEIAGELGFELISSTPHRSMRSSPQQGWRQELAETLLTFQRPSNVLEPF